MRIVLGVFYLLHFLPRWVFKGLAWSLGNLLYLLSPARRRVGRYNLRQAFPELDERARNRLLRQHYRLFMLGLLDHAYLWYGSAARLRTLIRIEGLESLPEGPQLWFAPHFNGLAAGGQRIVLERACSAVYVHQKNPVLDQFMQARRERFGNCRMLSRQAGVRAILQAYKDGFQLHYSPDLDYGARDAVFVPFFGQLAATVTALPRLAKITRAMVVPMVTTMEPHGYTIRFHAAWADYPSEDVVADVRRMNAWLEDMIRQYPAQYFWLHKRYKTRPDGERNPYKAD